MLYYFRAYLNACKFQNTLDNYKPLKYRTHSLCIY